MRKSKVKTAPTPPAEANPETIREPNPEAAGLGVLIQHTYAKRPVSDYIDLAAAAGARSLTEMEKREEAQIALKQQKEALSERNRAGAVTKAKKYERLYQKKKQIVRQVYNDLKGQLEKIPTSKVLVRTLIAKYPKRKWSEKGTIKNWIAKLNKGEDI